MKPGHASRTAQYMALFRAVESARSPGRRLFDDPFARGFLDAPLALVVRLAGVPGLGRLVPWFIDRRWPGARSAAVARTRFIDDAVGASLHEGVEQVVILGAGFDARAHRLPALQEVVVFEVDHPDTLAAKRAALAGMRSGVAGHVRHVATDFNQGKLERAMVDAGYRSDAPTLFLWEGVTNYLTEAAVDATVRWCAQAAPGSRLVFTYVHRAVLDDPASFFGTERLMHTLRDAGETWTFGLDPARVCDFLEARGLALERDLGAADCRRLYWGDAASRMRGYAFYRIAVARVGALSEGTTPTPTRS